MVRWLKIVAFLLLGAIFGPLLLAVGTALAPTADLPSQAVYDLLDEFDSRDRSITLSSTDFSWFARQCGYEPDTLFTAQDQDVYPTAGPWKWSPHAGYFDLAMHQRANWSHRLAALRAERLDTVTSDFSARFLRQCMRGTLFASLCARRTEALLGEWKSARSGPASAGVRLDTPGEQGTICAYLDGVAARRGLTLAKR